MVISVVHTKTMTTSAAHEVYIGRPSPLGNPFVLYKHGDRDCVIELYRVWLKDKMWFESAQWHAIKEIADLCNEHEHVRLVCWCAPEACHGDVIKEYVIEQFKHNCDPDGLYS